MARHYIRGAKGRFAGSTGGGGGGRRGGHGRGGGGTTVLMHRGRQVGAVSKRGGVVHTGPSSARYASRSRLGKIRTMDARFVGRNGSGRAVLIRHGSGTRPARAPFQRGLTHRGHIIVRSHGKTYVAKTYRQKIRVPGSISTGSRSSRTAYVHSPRR